MADSVSVVIPTFNREASLKRALDSVLEQTHRVNEIIVVDDGSEDQTVEMVERNYPQVILVNQPHQGVSAARNVGIKKSMGRWIAFLDSDDMWHQQKIERQLEEIEKNPKSVLCHTDEIWIRRGVRVNPKQKHVKRGGWIYQHCLPLCCLSPSSVMIFKELFDEIGLFDESLPACEDYDLWLRICSRYPVLFVDDLLLVKYGGHEDQLSRKIKALDRYRIKALEKILKSNVLNDHNQRLTLKELCQKITIYLQGAKKRNKKEEVSYYQNKLDFYLGVNI